MSIHTVAVLSPGEMGHAVGQLLREHELRVITCLAGRSARTRALAEKAGIIDIPTLEELVAQSDVILSITVSEAAPSLCREIAEAVHSTQAQPLFAECNAIAPHKVRQLEPLISAAGGRFVDASIIGGPPRNGVSPPFYTSGPHAAEFEQMRQFGLEVRNIGTEIGQASGIKMAFAALTKGSAALYTQLLLAAERMGLSEHLREELQSSQPVMYRDMERRVPGAPAKARRWISEMEEIQATFQQLGLSPELFQGIAEVYRFLASTPLAEEWPESRDRNRGVRETIRQLATWVRPERA